MKEHDVNNVPSQETPQPNPQVSVILPCLNEEESISQTIAEAWQGLEVSITFHEDTPQTGLATVTYQDMSGEMDVCAYLGYLY